MPTLLSSPSPLSLYLAVIYCCHPGHLHPSSGWTYFFPGFQILLCCLTSKLFSGEWATIPVLYCWARFQIYAHGFFTLFPVIIISIHIISLSCIIHLHPYLTSLNRSFPSSTWNFPRLCASMPSLAPVPWFTRPIFLSGSFPFTPLLLDVAEFFLLKAGMPLHLFVIMRLPDLLLFCELYFINVYVRHLYAWLWFSVLYILFTLTSG